MRRFLLGMSFVVMFPLLIVSTTAAAVAPPNVPAPHPAAHVTLPAKHLPAKTRVDLRHGILVPSLKKQTGKSGPSPDIALWQEGCYQNTAYFMWFDVNGQWRDTFSNNDGNVQTTVFYMWCPRWPGDGVGLNFAGGTARPDNQCAQIDLGWWNANGPNGPSGSQADGAALIESDGNIVPDGLNLSQDWICPGQQITDWSIPAPGSGQYIARFVTNYWMPYSTSGWTGISTPWLA